MDGQNFENENNVTVDTTATEVSSAAETVQETPVTEQPVNNSPTTTQHKRIPTMESTNWVTALPV